MLTNLRPLGVRGIQGLGQASTVQAQITAAANQYGVPPALAIAVAQQESGFNQTNSSGGTLTSSAGALGVMQLMPATAAGLGVDPTNQQQNIQGGVQLLSQLLQQNNGSVPLALAAYNSGQGNVNKYGGVPPFPETQNYVSSIMANYTALGGSSTAASIASSSTDTSDSDPTSTDTFDLSGVSDALSSIDWTDPATLGIAAAAIGAAALYAIFG